MFSIYKLYINEIYSIREKAFQKNNLLFFRQGIKVVFIMLELNSKKTKKIIATVGIEPTTLRLLVPRSNQAELCGYLIIYKNYSIYYDIMKYFSQKNLYVSSFYNFLFLLFLFFIIFYSF